MLDGQALEELDEGWRARDALAETRKERSLFVLLVAPNGPREECGDVANRVDVGGGVAGLERDVREVLEALFEAPV
jgi:hypothetical protein